MKLLKVESLAIDAVKLIRFGYFRDHRGYFTEHYRKSDFDEHPEMSFMRDVEFLQCNQSYSLKGTVRGLHFQWNPYMGKLVRTLAGRMIDVVLDIRKGSPTFGKGIMIDIPANPSMDYGDWVWVPPGFAHGNFFTEDTLIEYFCSGSWSPGCEAGISPRSDDIDWSLCDPELKSLFNQIVPTTKLISQKDHNGLTVQGWQDSENSDRFIYGEM